MNPFEDPLKGLREKEPPAAAAVEGFICPECFKKHSTMTELLAHVETKHSSIGDGSSPSREKNSTSSAGGQMRSLFGKLRKKNSPTMSNGIMNSATLAAVTYVNEGDPFADEDDISLGFNEKLVIFEELDFSEDGSDEDIEESSSSGIVLLPGIRRSHWQLFKEHRDKLTERNNLVTNKLMIRLDRILTAYPELDDFYKRKAHEQTVVEWVPANLVANCPICTAKFGLFGSVGGRHHCRLCGAVICFRCSAFFSFQRANELIAPTGAKLKMPQMTKGLDRAIKPEPTISSMGKMLSYLNFELNPELDPTHWDQLRVCLPCDHLLAIRSTKSATLTVCPLTQAFTAICTLKGDIDNSVAVYRRMARSLRRGETDYKLLDAKQLQVDIGGLCARMNAFTEKIVGLQLAGPYLPTEDEEELVARRALAQRYASIQAAIRRNVLAWCQKAAAALPVLPSEKDYERLKVLREERIQRRINREKAIVLREQNDTSGGPVDNANTPKSRRKEKKNLARPVEVAIYHEDGFSYSSADCRLQVKQTDDPFEQQISLLQHFISEARTAKRFDEVTTLEQSLKELEIEQYLKQVEKEEEEKARANVSLASCSNNPFGSPTEESNPFNETLPTKERESLNVSSNPFAEEGDPSPSKDILSTVPRKSDDYPEEFDPFA